MTWWWWILPLAAICLRRPVILWLRRLDLPWRVRSTPTHLVVEKAAAPVAKREPKPASRLCKFCGGAATHQSKVDHSWRCNTCIPCWCNWCMGRVGVHGEDAKALHRATIDSIARKYGG